MKNSLFIIGNIQPSLDIRFKPGKLIELGKSLESKYRKFKKISEANRCHREGTQRKKTMREGWTCCLPGREQTLYFRRRPTSDVFQRLACIRFVVFMNFSIHLAQVRLSVVFITLNTPCSTSYFRSIWTTDRTSYRHKGHSLVLASTSTEHL